MEFFRDDSTMDHIKHNFKIKNTFFGGWGVVLELKPRTLCTGSLCSAPSLPMRRQCDKPQVGDKPRLHLIANLSHGCLDPNACAFLDFLNKPKYHITPSINTVDFLYSKQVR